MNQTEKLRKQHIEAVEYVGYLGRHQHHLNSAGKLSKCVIATQMNFQHNSGSTNYWTDENFDQYLSKVIQARFPELAQQAIERMKQAADASLLQEEVVLKERLAEIEQLKGVQE